MGADGQINVMLSKIQAILKTLPGDFQDILFTHQWLVTKDLGQDGLKNADIGSLLRDIDVLLEGCLQDVANEKGICDFEAMYEAGPRKSQSVISPHLPAFNGTTTKISQPSDSMEDRNNEQGKGPHKQKENRDEINKNAKQREGTLAYIGPNRIP